MIKMSIRARITLLITFVFISVLVLLLSSEMLAIYLGMTGEIDRELRRERNFVRELFEREFSGIIEADSAEAAQIQHELEEDLDEIIGFKNQFVLLNVVVKNGTTRRFSDSRHDVEIAQIPAVFFDKSDEFFNKVLNNRRYRVNISQNPWGTLVVGLENRTFYEIAGHLENTLLVGIPVTLAIVLLGSWFLAKLVMVPVVNAAKTAKNITLSNLEQRLPDYVGKDEFGILVTTLNGMIARIEEGVNQIRQFTQDAAHELRTPLTIQRGELELLYEQNTISEDNRVAIQRTLERAISMSKIVENLMLLAQSDSKAYPLKKQKFRLDDVMREIAEDCQILADDRPISVQLDRCDKIDFSGDEQLIRRLLLNLVDNALKNTERGAISLSLIRKSGNVKIRISDTGCGIPPEKLPHIFDRFFRVDNARSGFSGSGLGLSICRWIVAAHGGSISAESKLGVGSTFTVDFPGNEF